MAILDNIAASLSSRVIVHILLTIVVISIVRSPHNIARLFMKSYISLETDLLQF